MRRFSGTRRNRLVFSTFVSSTLAQSYSTSSSPSQDVSSADQFAPPATTLSFSPTSQNISVVATATASPSGDPESSDVETTENYWYVFVAAAVVLVIGAMWLEHKRRKRRKERARSGRQTALAQDLDGWPSTRRWLYGNWRSEPVLRRQEGLNEEGEAPPPYARISTVNLPHNHGRPESLVGEGAAVAEPSEVVTRDRIVQKPPDYEPSLSNSGAPSNHSQRFGQHSRENLHSRRSTSI